MNTRPIHIFPQPDRTASRLIEEIDNCYYSEDLIVELLGRLIHPEPEDTDLESVVVNFYAENYPLIKYEEPYENLLSQPRVRIR